MISLARMGILNKPLQDTRNYPFFLWAWLKFIFTPYYQETNETTITPMVVILVLPTKRHDGQPGTHLTELINF